MIHYIALIHLLSFLQSQMAKLSNSKRRHQNHSEDTLPLLNHSSDMRPELHRKRKYRPESSPRGNKVRSSRLRGRIALRKDQRFHSSKIPEGAWWTDTNILNTQNENTPKEKDREDWLQRLRPRSPRPFVSIEAGRKKAIIKL